MTDVQVNPYAENEPLRAKPVTYVLQGRTSMAEPFRAVTQLSRDSLEKYRQEVDKVNAQAGYRKWRIVTR